MTNWIYSFGEGSADGRAEMKNLLGGKGANLAEIESSRAAGAARLHHHHRGLHLLLRQRAHLSETACRRCRQGAGLGRKTHRRQVRRCRQSASRLRPVGRTRLDAGHDGYGAQSRPQRPDRRRPCQEKRRRAIRLRFLSPLYSDVCPSRARGRPSSFRRCDRAAEAGDRQESGHRAHRQGLAASRRRLQIAGTARVEAAVPAGPAGAAMGRHWRGVRFLDEPARHHLSPPP